MGTKAFNKKGLSLIALLATVSLVWAQPNQTLTNFYTVPQIGLINPALRTPGKVTFGLPGLSGLHSHVSNQILDLQPFDKDKDFQLELERQVMEMEEGDFLQTNVDYDLLFVGFEVAEHGYLSIGASYRFTQTTTLAPDMLKFFVFGNQPYIDVPLDWSSTGVSGQHYAYYHIGYAHDFLDGDLSVGGRIKMISGMGGLDTELSQLTVLTETSSPEPYTIYMTAEGVVNTAGFAAEGLTAGDVLRSGFSFTNAGFGLDLGARYKFSNEWSATASVNDLGSITWKDNVENYQVDETQIELSGVSYDLFSSEGESFDDRFSTYFDSIGKLFDPDTNNTEFTTSLNRKINLGVQWRFHEKHELGLQFFNENTFGTEITALGLSWYGDLAEWFQMKVQYTAYENGFDNIGLGFALGQKFQWHFMADYLNGLGNITTWNEFNFRTGFSFSIMGQPDNHTVPSDPSPPQVPSQNTLPQEPPMQGSDGGGLVYYYD